EQQPRHLRQLPPHPLFLRRQSKPLRRQRSTAPRSSTRCPPVQPRRRPRLQEPTTSSTPSDGSSSACLATNRRSPRPRTKLQSKGRAGSTSPAYFTRTFRSFYGDSRHA